MVFHTSCPGDYTNIINNCIQLHKSGHVKTDFLLAKLLTDLLTLCVTNRISGQPNETSEQLEQIREYIDRHLQQKLSLTTIADQFFVNKFYLARAFRLSFGMTWENISAAPVSPTPKNCCGLQIRVLTKYQICAVSPIPTTLQRSFANWKVAAHRNIAKNGDTAKRSFTEERPFYIAYD